MFLEGSLWDAGCDAAYSDNLVFFAAAIFLPYIAVVIANDVKHETEQKATVVDAPVLRLEAKDFTIVTPQDEREDVKDAR